MRAADKIHSRYPLSEGPRDGHIFCLHPPSNTLEMVAVAPTQPTGPAKKNRRKESKKKAAKAPSGDAEMAGVDSDNEPEQPEASTSTPPAAPIDSVAEAEADDDDMMLDAAPLDSNGGGPTFAPLPASAGKTVLRSETRRIPIPPHRMTPLKKEWVNVFGPLTEILGLQVRMNVQRRCVEARTSKATKDIGALQKGADFVKAFALGFDVNDAIALLRLDDLYLDSFEIKDVKTLQGDHLSRAIGRIAGQDGKTKFTIENASRTRIVLADTKIHIMGSFQNIKIARDAIVSLILGSPPGKVYAGLRTVASRMRQRAL
ncbi:hypothetical protein HMN09_00028400 [Mycena chlorophos]|uniref:Pre-rRNA-processing protein PNO1 n=1 Tax=Mycena chlorophos TaxID=658473 RepID=A0A8H6WKZ1_MYCCL|nr:hypothetical protein HMN09_00028400 [Mycena chlorophos]